MSPAYHQSVGGALYRRSLYTVWKRTAPMPDMTEFDAPFARSLRCQTQLHLHAATGLRPAQRHAIRRSRPRAGRKGHATRRRQTPDRIRFAFWRLTARAPERKELAVARDLWQEQKEIFTKEPDRARQLIAVGDRKRATRNSTPAIWPP
jgi:hypothetical protein